MRWWWRRLRHRLRRRPRIEAHWWDIPAVPNPDPTMWAKAIDDQPTETGDRTTEAMTILELLGDLPAVTIHPSTKEHADTKTGPPSNPNNQQGP